MRRVLVLVACGAVFLGITALVAAYNGGNGDEDMPTPSGGCSNALGCHSTWSGNATARLAVVADDGVWDTAGESGTITVTVNMDAANSNDDIAGVMLLDPDVDDNIKASGWTITQDPNLNATPYNYNEAQPLAGDVDFVWNVNAPDSSGTYPVVARVLFDDGGPRHNESEVVEITVYVGVSEDQRQPRLALSDGLMSYPNPFSRSTIISYQLTTGGRATLKVFDVTGRVVRSLLDGQATDGWHSVVWDGRDNMGRDAPGGLYLYTLEAGGVVSTGKTVLLR